MALETFVGFSVPWPAPTEEPVMPAEVGGDARGEGLPIRELEGVPAGENRRAGGTQPAWWPKRMSSGGGVEMEGVAVLKSA